MFEPFSWKQAMTFFYACLPACLSQPNSDAHINDPIVKSHARAQMKKGVILNDQHIETY